MKTVKLLIAATFSVCSCGAFAQWQWQDEAGRKVFSDRPPPAHISPQKILKQPGVRAPAAQEVGRYVAVSEQDEAAANEAQKEAAHNAKEKEKADLAQQEAEKEAKEKEAQEEQRKLQEAEEKKAQAQQAKAKQENCARARAAKLTLESGVAMGYTNEKGERGFMPEAQRKLELQRAQQVIKESCV